MDELLKFLVNNISSIQMYQSLMKNKDCLFSTTQCSNTRDFFLDLFTNKKLKCDKKNNDTNVTIEIYSMIGSIYIDEKQYINIPDHTFIIIKYRKEIYLLQSYYHAYNYSGIYGLIPITIINYNELKQILNFYKDIYIYMNKTNKHYINEIDLVTEVLKFNKRFSYFTGIDSNHHYYDTINKGNVLYQDETIICTLETFIKNIYDYLEGLDFKYYIHGIHKLYIYDAFLGENLDDKKQILKYTGLNIDNLINNKYLVNSSKNNNKLEFEIDFDKFNIVSASNGERRKILDYLYKLDLNKFIK